MPKIKERVTLITLCVWQQNNQKPLFNARNPRYKEINLVS
jgi:hypothetical protein